MKLYFAFSTIIALYYLLFKSKKAMHMMQQNWYNDGNRYLNWVITNYKKTFYNFDIFFIIFIGLYFIHNSLYLF